LEFVDKEEEWLESSIKQNTKLHHAKAMSYLKEFMQETPENILKRRTEEAKRFNTRVIGFWKWLKESKKLSESTASSYVFGVAGFFSYYELDLKLRGKIPDTKMKIEGYEPKLEHLQMMFRLGDLQTKLVLSIMRDVPCRVGDLVKSVIPRIGEGEFLIESEKENVVGKCYVSEETLELYKQLEKASLALPTTKGGIAKLLERISNVASVPVWNPHLLRKLFFTTATNLNINSNVVKVLIFKSVPKDILTYLLNRSELKEAWKQVINAIPMEAKTNGRVDSMQESLDLLMKAFRKMVEKELNSGMYERGPYMELKEKPTDRQVLEKYLEA
jgi:hypothetical protein